MYTCFSAQEVPVEASRHKEHRKDQIKSFQRGKGKKCHSSDNQKKKPQILRKILQHVFKAEKNFPGFRHK